MAKLDETETNIPELITASIEHKCRCCKKTIPKGDKCWFIAGSHEHTNCALYENRREELIEMDARLFRQEMMDLRLRDFL